MKQLLISIIFVICGGTVIGCSPNERVFYKGNIACSASNRNSEQWEYYTAEFGVPDMPYSGSPVFEISIPGLEPFMSNSITTEDIANITNVKFRKILAIENTPNVGRWSKTAKRLYCGSYLSFVIVGNKILQIKITHNARFRMIHTDKWYNLPCTESELIEAFGEPDKTYEWFRE